MPPAEERRAHKHFESAHRDDGDEATGGRQSADGTTEVFGGSDACELAEVVNEVRLVGIAEVESELDAVEGFARVKTFQQLMQAVTADDPLRRRAYIGLEEPLQCADAEAAPPCEGRYGEDGGIVQDGVDERCGECAVGVRCGQAWGEVRSCGRSHGFGGVEGAELCGEGKNVWAEDLRSGDDAIGERGDRVLQERAQSSGFELEAEDAAVALHGA